MLFLERLFSGLRPVVALIILFGLAGCASLSTVAPGANSIPDEEAAILEIDQSVKASVRPQLNAIYDEYGSTVIPSESFKDYHRIKVAPGAYTVQLKVYSAGHYPAFPRIRIRARSGKTYLFTGNLIMDGRAVRAEYTEIPTPPAVETKQ
ncbi:MAG: hypothetical protein E2576_06930 [Alcaligenaceae bacterium]|nr:hypothetical protein [Alcaligenaceae bacterium SAGV5]MPS53346.1 hypothetical protein [Alcaligenaceae bacterium SAGV3]MPT56446.1 hypothetical protein [Alcaligenaceae bacterium]